MKFSRVALGFAVASSCVLQPPTFVIADDQAVEPVACNDTLPELWEEVQNLDPVTETNVLRKYYICEGEYNIGFPDNTGTFQGNFPLLLRPNIQYICQDDDYTGNGCVFNGGFAHILGLYWLRNRAEYLENVLVKGFTFNAGVIYGLAIDNPGRVRLENCIFQNMQSYAPIFLYWTPEIAFEPNATSPESIRKRSGPSELDSPFAAQMREMFGGNDNSRKLQEVYITPTQVLEVDFFSCQFLNNKEYFVTANDRVFDYLAGMMVVRGTEYSGQVWGNTTSSVTIRDSLFEDNVFITYPDSLRNRLSYVIAVDNDSAHLTLENNCFYNTTAPGGLGPVLSSGPVSHINNSGVPIEDTECQFISIVDAVTGMDGDRTIRFPEGTLAEDFRCEEYDADFCSGPRTPAPSVSLAPSSSPSLAPSSSHRPSVSMAPSPEPSTTFTPSASPSTSGAKNRAIDCFLTSVVLIGITAALGM
mmetsp:Transcript_21243/g.32679  ORF Transcript_21243/g.32679 Transcript_21243/m.32679 type:complete len:473 (+) Transcript_21243:375-1793(+)|eukprot:CAMPEP_0195294078 /NCGR_PEP_ID=MMETSP0707-20130614/14115_1 /TAXON_ID=33640 /ORGANISM="Asterionellopsis glacialis, Strain CCMP134" /LENGTH=472 /DNA_ID=CAMNT_0040354961 /DNA_START=274 /DNA_END=1692 /DNA_ORIENTATION=-